MPNIKTAVSIKDTIYAEADELASELNMSRSKLFSLAVSEFIERHRNRQLLDALNHAYDDELDE